MNETEEKRIFLINADTVELTGLLYGAGWNPVDTLPDKGLVECLTVTGLVRIADCSRKRGDIKPSDEKGPRRRTVPGTSGAVQAIAWREYNASPKGADV